VRRKQKPSKRCAFPLPAESWQPSLAREQFLHGSLLDVALLGDESVQRGDESIHIAQGGSDSTLFISIGGMAIAKFLIRIRANFGCAPTVFSDSMSF